MTIADPGGPPSGMSENTALSEGVQEIEFRLDPPLRPHLAQFDTRWTRLTLTQR